MKGGIVPIHIMRWAPADFLSDPFVMMIVAEGRYEVYMFYRQFIDVSFLEGGRVRDDIRLLAALSGLSQDVAQGARDFCVEAGKLASEDGWLYHQRVVREVERELDFRTAQSNASRTRSEAVRIEQARTAGRRSAEARAAKYGSAQPIPRTRTSGSNVHPNVPPSPSPAPAPSNVHPSLRDVGGSEATPSTQPVAVKASVVEAVPQSVGRPGQLKLRGTNPRPLTTPGGWPARVVRLWAGAGTPARVGAALSQVVDRFGEERVLGDLEKWLIVPGNARFGIETFARTVGESEAVPQSDRSREMVASIKAEILGGMK